MIKRSGANVICSNCNQQTYKSPSIIGRNSKNYFCSKKCKNDFGGKDVHCSNCGKKIHRIRFQLNQSKSGMYFCSQKCGSVRFIGKSEIANNITKSGKYKLGDHWRGKKRPEFSDEWKKKIGIAGIGRTMVHTEETKEKMRKAIRPKMYEHVREKQSIRMTGNKYRLGDKASYETRKKMSRSQKKGKDHWNWKGGASKLRVLIRHSVEYKMWRTSIFIRDNRACVWCGSKTKIEADHIKPFAVIKRENNIKSLDEAIACVELWDINNGRTLCHECHKTTPSYCNWKKQHTNG